MPEAALQIKPESIDSPAEYESLDCSTESLLWVGVLETWIKDARRARSPERRSMLRKKCYTEWTEKICEWVDLDYEYFVRMMETALEKKEMRRHHITRRVTRSRERKSGNGFN